MKTEFRYVFQASIASVGACRPVWIEADADQIRVNAICRETGMTETQVRAIMAVLAASAGVYTAEGLKSRLESLRAAGRGRFWFKARAQSAREKDAAARVRRVHAAPAAPAARPPAQPNHAPGVPGLKSSEPILAASTVGHNAQRAVRGKAHNYMKVRNYVATFSDG